MQDNGVQFHNYILSVYQVVCIPVDLITFITLNFKWTVCCNAHNLFVFVRYLLAFFMITK